MQNLLNDLTKLLDDYGEFTDENGNLLKNKVVEYALKLDSGLLRLLLKSKTIKKHFFTEVDGLLVFDKIKFQAFVSNKEFLPDSYTAFKNKIGLVDEKGDFLASSGNVTLAWPYKDCILEGGQTKEDQQRNEIFWNETLAPDEIYRLFTPKVIVNWKRTDSKGEHILSGNEKIDFDKENFIIKGNNLLALHSIYKRFAEKVKLIYIDPPYNTGKDSFKYNDKFNHSTWLSFMKNRLEIAKTFLRNDGVIFVSTDDGEFAHLKVLMDELFLEENFLGDIIWNSTKSVTNTAIVSVSHTHNLVYFRNKDYFVKNREEFRLSEDGQGFSNPDNDPRGPWKADPFQVGGWRPNQQYSITNPITGVKYKPNKGCSWKNDFTKFQELLKDNRIVFGSSGESGPQRKRFLYEAEERGKVVKTIWDDVGATTNGTQHLNALFGEHLFDNPKPETFIQRILELSTKPEDMVLDFFAGSGTTGATAHKMNRRYILIEQMDYIHDLPEARLKKVIKGEQGGISKSTNWKGGGSFIYCELMEWNEAWMTKIQKARTTVELKAIWKDMSKNAYLNYCVNAEAINENISDFEELSLKEQKQFLVETLDKNCLYVDYSEIKDRDYKVSETDKKLNVIFYSEK
jgi:adenine-specific DNA-methyltransferase